MKINTNLKHHIVIGILFAIWSFLFGFFVRPFEHGTMDLMVWIRVSTGFSVAGLISYNKQGFDKRLQ